MRHRKDIDLSAIMGSPTGLGRANVFPIAAAALIGGGLAAGGLGSFLGASSSNKAAKKAAEAERRDQANLQRTLGSLEIGPGDYRDLLLATNNTAGLFFAGDPAWYKATDADKQAAAARFFSKYPSLQSIMREAGPRLVNEQEQLLNKEQGRTRQLDQMARQAEGFGKDLQGREGERINRDYERDLKGANQRSMAALGFTGSNTLIGNQMASNQRQLGYQRDDALLAAAKAATDRLTASRNTRMTQLGQRYGLEGNLQDDLSRLRYQMALAPAQSLQGVFGGGAFQPMQRSAAAYGQYSPLGNALGSLGPALSTLGAAALSSGGNQGSGNPGGMWNGRSAADFARIKGYG
jgi:hypothetical protein